MGPCLPVTAQSHFIQFIPFSPRSRFRPPARAAFVGEFQASKLTVGIAQSPARNLDVRRDGSGGGVDLAAARDDSGEIGSEIHAFAAVRVLRDFPLPGQILFKDEAPIAQIFSLPQQRGKIPTPVVDRRLGHANHALKVGHRPLFPIVDGCAENGAQCGQRVFEGCRFGFALRKKPLQGRIIANCFLDRWIGASAVGAEAD